METTTPDVHSATCPQGPDAMLHPLAHSCAVLQCVWLLAVSHGVPVIGSLMGRVGCHWAVIRRDGNGVKTYQGGGIKAFKPLFLVVGVLGVTVEVSMGYIKDPYDGRNGRRVMGDDGDSPGADGTGICP